MRLLAIAFQPTDQAVLATFAHKLGLEWTLLTFGTAQQFGQSRTMAAESDALPDALPDALGPALADLAKDHSHVVAVSSMFAKATLAALAGVIDAAVLTDVVDVLDPTTFRRPVVAGSLIATVQAEPPAVISIRPAGFPATEPAGPAESERVNLATKAGAELVARSQKSGGRPDLAQAKVVVSGGRPLRDAETFESLIGGLADRLGGAAGATRAAVDSGIAGNALQVGQTGKIVAPDLYIAAGVSGSTQHLAGMKDSRTIVAINTDPDAPIFEVADLGLVADLHQVIAEVIRKLG